MKPKITVISVIYNDIDSIVDTINSVVEQRRKRPDVQIDYVIIDGNSTDGTLELLKKYDLDITKWISEKDRGIYDAMNKGLAMVDNGYVLFLGAGDKIISLIDSQLLLGDKMNTFYGDVWIGDRLFTSNIDCGLKRGNSLHHQALLVNRSVFPNEGFDSRYKAYADYDLNIKLLNSGINFIRSNDLIGFQSPGGLTSKIHIMETLDIIKNHFGTINYYIVLCEHIFSKIKNFFLKSHQNNYSWVKLR